MLTYPKLFFLAMFLIMIGLLAIRKIPEIEKTEYVEIEPIQFELEVPEFVNQGKEVEIKGKVLKELKPVSCKVSLDIYYLFGGRKKVDSFESMVDGTFTHYYKPHYLGSYEIEGKASCFEREIIERKLFEVRRIVRLS